MAVKRARPELIGVTVLLLCLGCTIAISTQTIRQVQLVFAGPVPATSAMALLAAALLFAFGHRIMGSASVLSSQHLWWASLAWCASSLLATQLPMDLFAKPPGAHLVSISKDASILACYRLDTHPVVRHSGGFALPEGRYFGWTWRTRRGLSRLDGVDTGPTITELHSPGEMHGDWLSVCAFRSGSETNAILLRPVVACSSGAYGVSMTLLQQHGQEWRRMRTERTYIDMDDILFVFKAFSATSAVICPGVFTLVLVLRRLSSKPCTRPGASPRMALLMIAVFALLFFSTHCLGLILLGPRDPALSHRLNILTLLMMVLAYGLYRVARVLEHRTDR